MMRNAQLSAVVLSALIGAACTPAETDTGWVPEDGWTNDEPADHTTVFSGLDDPRGLVTTANGLAVAEMDEGRVVEIVDGGLSILADGLDEPYMLAASTSGVVATERGAGRVLYLADDTITVLSDGQESPGRVVAQEDSAWWIDEGSEEIWAADLNTSTATVLAAVDDPTGLDWTSEGLLVTRAGSCDCLSLIDLETGVETELIDVEENPVDVLATEAGIFMSAESHYWPYGGWLYSIDAENESASSLSYSPPGPAWLAANDTHLFWTTDGNIVAVPLEGGTYQTLAILTAPGDLAVTEDAIFWTDRQRGAVLTVALP